MNAPTLYEPPKTDHDPRPRAIFWYRVYAGFMAIFSMASLGLAIVMLQKAHDLLYGAGPAIGPLELAIMVAIASALALFYVVATFVPFKPWGWTLALAAIALGAAGCTIFIALPLLLQWTKPTVKAAFGRL
ncbi:MAG: hypothetical protein KF819_22045 [Labilithrix sp.]|nr:hypothetical protein [Labilithrix sp.]